MTKDSVDDLNSNEKKFLISLIEDGSKTDTEIAAEQEMSKSTANRIRRRLEDEGVIQEYIPIVQLESIGVDVFASISMVCDGEIDEDEIAAMPNVIFLGETDDFQQKLVVFAGFSSFEEYNTFIEEFKEEYRGRVSEFDNNLIAPGNILKEDFTHLIKHKIRTSLREEGDDA